MSDEAESADLTAIRPKIGVTLHGLTLKEVYEITVTVTNTSYGKLNLGEGGEDTECSDINRRLVTK